MNVNIFLWPADKLEAISASPYRSNRALVAAPCSRGAAYSDAAKTGRRRAADQMNITAPCGLVALAAV